MSSARVQFPAVSELDQVLDPAHSPLNPRRDDADGNAQSFAYGTLPIYVQGTTSWLLDLIGNNDHGNYANLYRVGRTLTALLDIVTLVFAYLLARRLFGQTAGLIAAALYAVAVLPIQLSHFFTVDPWLTAFVTATIYLLVRFLDRPTIWRSIVIGLAVGAAFATKASVVSLLVPVLVVYAYLFWTSPKKRRMFAYGIVGGIVSLLMFSLFEPYAIVLHAAFIHDIRTQARIVRGQFDVPFTRQFVGLTPGLYELHNMFRFTVGPGLLLAAIAGMVYTARRAYIKHNLAMLVPIVWLVAYVPILLVTEARFLRYSLPLIPFMAVFAAGILAASLRSARWKTVGRFTTIAALGITTIWAIGFASIYSRENPRIAASKWMYANIPQGSVLTAEAWDDALPLPVSGPQTNQFETQSLDIYSDLPPADKVAYLYETLANVDYVVMSSDRLYLSVDNLPWRYAVQNEYYRRLLNGQLGFQQVYFADLQPELFGYRYDDSSADESFSVYDHPRVRIFKKIEQLSEEDFKQRFQWAIAQPWEPARYPERQSLRLGQPVETISSVDDAGYNSFAVRNPKLAIVIWLIVFECIGLAVLPAAATIFRQSADKGALSHRLLGLMLLGWLIWIGASLHFWPATSWTAAALLAIIGAANWLWFAVRRNSDRSIELPGARAYGASFGLYLGLFVLFLGFRTYYPDFWQTYLGGEKPFELAYLRAIAKSTAFPPYDPWFAGGIINYYYYGWHLIATVTKLSGVGISQGFQLAGASLAALLGTQIVAIGLLLQQSTKRIDRRLRNLALPVCALLLVMFIGNLDAARQAIQLRGAVGERFDFWGPTRVINYTINEFPYFSLLWADIHPHLLDMPVIALFIAILVAIISSPVPTLRISFAANQDAAIPILALTLVLGTIMVTNAWDMPLSIALCVAGLTYSGLLISKWRAVGMGSLGLVVSATAYLLFLPFHSGFYSVVEGVARTNYDSDLGSFLIVWGIFFAIVWAAITAKFIDSLHSGGTLDLAWIAVSIVVLAGGLTAFAASARGAQVETQQFAAAVVIGAIIIGMAAATVQLKRFALPLTSIIAGLTIASGALAPVRPAASLALALTTATAAIALTHWRTPKLFLPWAFVAVATITIAATELIYVVDDLQNGPWQRMNTVFKFYVQAWILLGIGSSALFVQLWRSSGLSLNRFHWNWSTGFVAGAGQRLAQRSLARMKARVSFGRVFLATGATVFILAGFAYPILGTPVRLRQTMPTTPTNLTLDGYAWMNGGFILNVTGEKIGFTGDLRAIQWLNSKVDGTPVIVEAAIGPYRGNGSRISSATGLPTPIGWDRHQYQQRYADDIPVRMQDVRQIYNSTDITVKLNLLRKYNARYVIVGDVERLWNTPDNLQHYASAAGLAAFNAIPDDELRLVFDGGSTKIYELEEFKALPPALGSEHHL